MAHKSRKDKDMSFGVFCTHVGSIWSISPWRAPRQDTGGLGSEKEKLGMRMGMSGRKTGRWKEKKKYQRKKDSGLGRERTKALQRKKIIRQAGKVKEVKTVGYGRI